MIERPLNEKRRLNLNNLSATCDYLRLTSKRWALNWESVAVVTVAERLFKLETVLGKKEFI